MAPPPSKLFTPFKAMGLVSSDKRMALRYLKNQRKHVLKVPVGNAFHIYAASNLSLMSVSEFHDSTVSCIVSGTPFDYTGTQSGSIYQWNDFHKLKKKFEGHTAEIHSMVVIGRDFLVSIDVENNMKVWNPTDGSIISDHPISQTLFDISVAVHPHAYLNKLLLGSRQGKMRLINIRSTKLLHTFNGWESGVSVIEPAPAMDVVAIGLEDGRIVMHNLRADETIFTLKQDWGMVTALSFRTDNPARLLSGSASGQIGLWDLEERILRSTVEEAHKGPIISLECARGDPIAYSSSTDNVLKTFVFDMPDGGARQLCIRDGHLEAPLKVRFHGSDGSMVLSGGLDSNLRSSCLTTLRGRSLGLACYNRSIVKKRGLKSANKMPAIVHITTDLTREEAWDNVAAIHLNTTIVTTWSYHKLKMNNEFLKHERFSKLKYEKAMATCIEISVCGNYVFIGYDTGHMEKFNIQSKIHKLSYPKQSSAIRGIVTDSLNFWVVAGLQDGSLQWFSLRKGELLATIDLDSGVQLMNINRESGLFAVALDDWSIIVIDIDNKVITRKLYGHHNQITDMAFSSDSKWLITSSMDHSIRTWDIPTGSCIDNFLVPTPATSISLSPIDDYLVSTHVDELGLYVWANRNCLTFVSLQPLKEDHTPKMLTLPSSSPDPSQLENEDSDDDSESDVEDMEEYEYKSPDQLSEDYVTIDLMPTSRWLTLLKIDEIKQRNKPVEGPKVLMSAPFFLETADGINSLVNNEITEENITDGTGKSKIIDFGLNILENLSPFGKLLKAGEHEAAFHLLTKKGPSIIDFEIRNLDPDLGGSREVMIQFLKMIDQVITKKLHFEVAQGYLGLFMKRHIDFLSSSDGEINEICKDIITSHKESWQLLEDDLDKSLCLLSYFKNSAVLNF